jgi:hypothetical protein
MVALKLMNFGGMIPAVDDNLLPQNHAALSQNAWVYSGAIEGFRELTPVHTLANPLAKKAFRIPIQYYDKDHIPDSYWLEFTAQDVDVIQSPTVDDQFDRFYWAGVGVSPTYNTKARIASGTAAYKLGIPAPTVAPRISRASGKYYLQASSGTFRATGGASKLYNTKAYTNDTGSLGSGGVDDVAYEQYGATQARSSTRGNLDASPTASPIETPKNRYAVHGRDAEMRYTTLVAGNRITISDTGTVTKGVPTQPSAATSSDPYEGLGVQETRAYVYTWVSQYGEEGPPSPATLYDGWSEDPWVITTTAPTLDDTTGRAITKLRIYRTITAVGGATTFFRVTEMDIAQTSFTDDIDTVTTAGNAILESTFWSAPPADLIGMVAMPNGIIAGWRKNEIWFTEPYRPHAWPATYTLAVEFPIVGFGVLGQTLVVLTSGSPYAISGINPASMALSRIASNQACLSRGSIVNTPTGVAYASPDGIAVAGPSGVQIVTRDMITKDLWLDPTEYLNIPSTRAAALNGGYFAWGSVGPGCFEQTAFDTSSFLQDDFTGSYDGAFIDASNARVSYTKLSSLVPTENCYADNWTGEVLIVRDGTVYWMDLANTRPHSSYIWRSKIFEAPNQRNFGAMRIWFSTFSDTPELNPVPNASPVQTLAANQWGLARVYADGALKFTRELRSSGEIFRLPSGFKAQFWQVEIEARIKTTSVEIATAAKELGSV